MTRIKINSLPSQPSDNTTSTMGEQKDKKVYSIFQTSDEVSELKLEVSIA